MLAIAGLNGMAPRKRRKGGGPESNTSPISAPQSIAPNSVVPRSSEPKSIMVPCYFFGLVIFIHKGIQSVFLFLFF